MITRDMPIITDFMPKAIFSAPRDGPIVLSSTKYMGAAIAPALKNKANSEASRGVLNPVIWNPTPRAL